MNTQTTETWLTTALQRIHEQQNTTNTTVTGAPYNAAI